MFVLHGSLYGLKQGPRAWFHCLSQALISYRFVKSKIDSSLLFYFKHGTNIYVLIYVDDIIVTYTDQWFISHLIGALSTKFFLKDLCSLHYFLSIEVVPHSSRFILSQPKYIFDLLQKASISDAKPVTTLLSTSAPLTKLCGPLFSYIFLTMVLLAIFRHSVMWIGLVVPIISSPQEASQFSSEIILSYGVLISNDHFPDFPPKQSIIRFQIPLLSSRGCSPFSPSSAYLSRLLQSFSVITLVPPISLQTRCSMLEQKQLRLIFTLSVTRQLVTTFTINSSTLKINLRIVSQVQV